MTQFQKSIEKILNQLQDLYLIEPSPELNQAIVSLIELL